LDDSWGYNPTVGGPAHSNRGGRYGVSGMKSRVNLGAGACKPVRMRKGGVVRKKEGGTICPEGKAWAKRTFDKYPSAYANLAASKYCKDPNYAKSSKKRRKKSG
jgi:hypothetical protein